MDGNTPESVELLEVISETNNGNHERENSSSPESITTASLKSQISKASKSSQSPSMVSDILYTFIPDDNFAYYSPEQKCVLEELYKLCKDKEEDNHLVLEKFIEKNEILFPDRSWLDAQKKDNENAINLCLESNSLQFSESCSPTAPLPSRRAHLPCSQTMTECKWSWILVLIK